MSDPAAISGAIDRIVSTGPVEIRENGQRVASLADFQYEVTTQSGRALLHLWSDGRSLARRVLRVVEQSPERVLLEVERFGQTKPGKLEFALTTGKTPKDLTREKFREEFAALLREQFPDEEIESLASAADLEHSISPRYTRGIVASSGARWAVLAASAKTSPRLTPCFPSACSGSITAAAAEPRASSACASSSHAALAICFAIASPRSHRMS